MHNIKEDLQTLILRCDENIQRIEERLEDLSDDNEAQDYLIRSQLEFLVLNTLDNKHNKERQLADLEQQEQWAKDHPMPTPGQFVIPPPAVLPIEVTKGTISPDDVESTVFFQHKTNPNMGNLVFKMRAGIYLDPMSSRLWTPTEDWTETKSLPGLAL